MKTSSRTDPVIITNAEGVWVETQPGSRSGIRWNEIYRIGAYKMDTITEVNRVVALDWIYGEFVEIYDCWDGFETALDEITHRMPGISPDWREELNGLAVDGKPLNVWTALPP